jgi:hypothetical protein
MSWRRSKQPQELRIDIRRRYHHGRIESLANIRSATP